MRPEPITKVECLDREKVRYKLKFKQSDVQRCEYKIKSEY